MQCWQWKCKFGSYRFDISLYITEGKQLPNFRCTRHTHTRLFIHPPPSSSNFLVSHWMVCSSRALSLNGERFHCVLTKRNLHITMSVSFTKPMKIDGKTHNAVNQKSHTAIWRWYTKIRMSERFLFNNEPNQKKKKSENFFLIASS